MSAFGAAAGRAVSALGGPQIAAVLVAAGLLAGALTGGAIAGGAVKGGTDGSSGVLSIYPCPNSGPALMTVPAGQRFLVTGRTEDGTWARIHYPLPGRTEAWVQVSPLTFDASLSTVPVATCEPVAAAAAPSFAPAATLTATQNNSPSPSPTPVPTPTPTPSPTPNASPSLTKLTVSTSKISYDQGSYCPRAVKQVTFKVKGGDDAGLADVTLFWRAPGSGSYTGSPMSLTAGTARDGTWQLTLDTMTNGIKSAGKLAFYAVGTNSAGATRRLPTSGADTITVAVCANSGPTIKSAASSSGSSLYWDPLGVGGCHTTTSISAQITDVDGVKSATLFYRLPGSASWSSKPMTAASGKWSAGLDTTKDKITIPSPPTDSLRWYIKAVDGKSVSSKTKTASITIRRCDSEAAFDGVFPISSTYPCTTATITIGTYANDADQPADGLKVVFYWTLENTRTNPPPISGHMTASAGSGNYYTGTTASFDGQTFYYGRLTVYAVTTDRYGGTTKSSSFPATMACR